MTGGTEQWKGVTWNISVPISSFFLSFFVFMSLFVFIFSFFLSFSFSLVLHTLLYCLCILHSFLFLSPSLPLSYLFPSLSLSLSLSLSVLIRWRGGRMKHMALFYVGVGGEGSLSLLDGKYTTFTLYLFTKDSSNTLHIYICIF